MKFLRVDMTTKSIEYQDVPKEYEGLGGRALTSIMINDQVKADCDPLGPDSKLILAPGLLSGTTLVNTSRISIGAKSPLTGGIKESNVGGTGPAALGRLGIAAVIIEGKAPEGDLYLLKIDEKGSADLMPAKEYRGMRTYALTRKLFSAYGDRNGIFCIGPAGERQMLVASIQSTDVDNRPCRAAGRGGLGAVMGSKGLKAIVVDIRGKLDDPRTSTDNFRKATKVFAKALREHPLTGQAFPALGTAMLVAPINAAGAFPSYNATKGVFDGWEGISGEKLAEILKERGGKTTHQGCSQCVIQCSNEYVDENGKYVTSSLEYETIWATGAMCGIDDLDTIAKLDFLCDDIGVDTMSTGVAVAIAMDAGYRHFGDREAVRAMIEEISKGTEMGKVLGGGPVAAGKHFNHHRVPVAKNQSIAAYDPRAIQGMAVTYATSPMGADHTAGWVVGSNLAALGGQLHPHKADGQVEVSRVTQIATAAHDATGLCNFTASVAHDIPAAGEAMLEMIGARLGKAFTAEDNFALGVRIMKAEREFNRKAGFTSKDDRLAPMFYEEALPPHNVKVVISDNEMDSTFDF